ncbi:MAG: glycosyltransferase [Tenericutes bacterium]|nr:glycosyltransferase [Mycoplasmatota bacterium]
MKKVLFIQIKGKSKAGVWFVNKTIGEELIKKGYEVEILSIRDNHDDTVLEYDSRLKIKTINETDLWEVSRKSDIKSFKTLKRYVKEHVMLYKDYKKAKDYIRNMNPDYIIVSHYQALEAIPKEFYYKTVHEQHSSMKDVKSSKVNYKTLMRYSRKIYGMIWLSQATKDEADKLGFKNNYCIYNPVRFNTNECANVEENKKLVCITRIENTQKRILLMVQIVDQILKRNNDWSFELYGFGNFDEESKRILKNNEKMKFMGKTDDPKDIYLSSSINLNTSKFEGFSLSILEASMCGIPTVSFNFGESVYEEIKNGKTGYIIENDDINLYIKKLEELMKNKTSLKEMSKKNKKFAKSFLPENIVMEWIDFFEKMDRKNKKKI